MHEEECENYSEHEKEQRSAQKAAGHIEQQREHKKVKAYYHDILKYLYLFESVHEITDQNEIDQHSDSHIHSLGLGAAYNERDYICDVDQDTVYQHKVQTFRIHRNIIIPEKAYEVFDPVENAFHFIYCAALIVSRNYKVPAEILSQYFLHFIYRYRLREKIIESHFEEHLPGPAYDIGSKRYDRHRHVF